MSNLRLSYLQKVGGGGVFVQAIPHPKMWGVGGGGEIHLPHPPPPPRIYASAYIYRVSPQKAERRIVSTLRAKLSCLLTSLDKTSSAEENDIPRSLNLVEQF